MLDERKNNVEDAAAVLSGLTESQATVENQVQILTSLELAGRVVDKLKFKQDPEFNPPLSGFGVILKYVNPLHWLLRNPKMQADAGGKTSNALPAQSSSLSVALLSIRSVFRLR